MSGDSYLRVRWLHDQRDEPVELWSELDAERYEIRKVEFWLDGRVGFASLEQSSGSTMLGTLPIPALSEIAADPEFAPEQISKREFENCWQAHAR